MSRLAAWLGVKTPLVVTGGAATVTIALPLGGYLDCTGTLTADLDIQVAAPDEGTIVKVANRSTAAGGANSGNSNLLTFMGLWIEPGGKQECVYINGAWAYSIGSGKAFVVKLNITSQLTATTLATVLLKVPAMFQLRDSVERSVQAPVGGTATTKLSAIVDQDVQTAHAVGVAKTFVQDTGSALSAGGILDNTTAYSITLSDTVSAPLGTAAITGYTFTFVDAT